MKTWILKSFFRHQDTIYRKACILFVNGIPTRSSQIHGPLLPIKFLFYYWSPRVIKKYFTCLVLRCNRNWLTEGPTTDRMVKIRNWLGATSSYQRVLVHLILDSYFTMFNYWIVRVPNISISLIVVQNGASSYLRRSERQITLSFAR